MAGTLTYGSSRLQTAIGRDTWQRAFRITGLENGPSIPALLVEALALVPDKGTPVPAPLVGMIVDQAALEDPFEVLGSAPLRWGVDGTLTYRTPTRTASGISVPDKDGPGVTVSTSTTTETRRRSLDLDGSTQITTSYDGVTQAHEIEYEVSIVTHTFVRPEEESPKARKDTFEGRVNLTPWNGYAAGTVLLQTVDSTTRDNLAWEVEYVFVVDPDAWNARVAHEDPLFPGHPLPRAGLSAPEIAAAFTSWARYNAVDFGPLNITLAP